MHKPRRTIGTLVFLLIGPLAWAAHFTVIYGAQSSLCAFDAGETAAGTNPLAGLIILVATLAGIGGVALAAWRPFPVLSWLAPGEAPHDRAFLAFVMRALAALSGLAMLYAGIASIVLPACAQLR